MKIPRILIMSVSGLIAACFLAVATAVTVLAQQSTGTDDMKVAQQSESEAVVKSGKHSYRGPRYQQRRYGYNFYYDGWYYPYGWWYEAGEVETPVQAPVKVNLAESDVAQHVEWCKKKFRSYDPKTDQYLAYSGKHRPCKSPYRN